MASGDDKPFSSLLDSAERPDGLASQLGRYEILQRIAVGGMAEILLARSASLGGLQRTCVIKRILPVYSEDLKFVHMFIDEARITLGLDHPNVVKLFEFGQHDGAYYMAMEYVDGTDLSELLTKLLGRREPLPMPAAVFIAREMCRGLHYAHVKRDHKGQPLGIVHRDISPQNVLLSRRGEVKLTDFGVAAARNKLTATSPGTVMGKSSFMSPEQAQGKRVDGRTDVWATGVILHEMLTGRRLFADENLVATLTRVLNDPVPAPSSLNSDIPAELDSIVLRALSRSLDARYHSAEEMGNALTTILDFYPFSAEDLADQLAQLEWSGITAPMRPSLSSQRPEPGPRDATLPFPHLEADDPEIDALVAMLRREPDLWTIVSMGDRYLELGQDAVALSAYRTAAAVFAHQGLLVQAICAYDGARQMLRPPEVMSDLIALAELEVGARAELEKLVETLDGHGFWALLQLMHRDQLGIEAADEPTLVAPSRSATPLFGHLGPREFAQLAAAVKVHRIAAEDVVLREGDESDTLYAVGRGRLVVHCRPAAREELMELLSIPGSGETTRVEEGRVETDDNLPILAPERIYLAALADGDFFGEFSFLTRRPRSATVEAITDCVVLEMDRRTVDEILDREPATSEPLLQFYKERVVELLMAKSPLFSLLDPVDRHTLLESSFVEAVEDQTLIVEEGTSKDALYFIKSGEVEVFRTDKLGIPIFINKLRPGQFFGEIAALTGIPRTVSVRAMGEVSLLRIPASELLTILDREPELREIFETTIEARTAQIKARVDEHRRVFSLT